LSTLNVPAESADRPLIGIAWMLATMFWFVTLDSTAKYLMQSYPVVQVIWAIPDAKLPGCAGNLGAILFPPGVCRAFDGPAVTPEDQEPVAG
jgi:hypothetical protein